MKDEVRVVEFNRVYHVQEVLKDMNEENLDESVQKLLKYVDLTLVRNIFRFSYLRPRLVPFYVKLIDNLKDTTNIIDILKSHLYLGFHLQANNLLIELSKKGVVHLSEVVKEEMRYKMNNSVDNYFVHSKIKKIIEMDDFDTFQSLAANPEFDVNMCVNDSEQQFKSGEKYNIIHCAAFYGATNIFKFLLMNHAKLSGKISTLAVCGGSPEIIRLLEQNNFIVNDSDLKYAIKYHHDDIFDWILEKSGRNCLTSEEELSCAENEFIHGLYAAELYNIDEMFFHACKNNFTEMVQYFVKNFNVDLNKGLSISSRYGSLEALKIILDTHSNKLDANEITEIAWKDKSFPLLEACANGHVEIVKYLIDNTNADVNRKMEKKVLFYLIRPTLI